MKMTKKILALCFASLTFSSFAASLQDQISAVATAESAAKSEARQLQEAERKRQLQQQKAEQARQAKAAAAKAAERQRILAEKQSEKHRDQGFEDELRQLEIQRQKLAIERENARVKRENEFIDQELNQKKATTDVIQSNADSNRNLSEGSKTLMESEGKAREKKAGRWFGG